MRRVFVIVPSASLSSPVKGAVALANAICRDRQVSVIALKPPAHAFALLDDRVERISLAHAGTWSARLRALRRILAGAGGRQSVATVSFCFSADVLNAFCGDLAVTCATVRGNLPEVYPETYGACGRWIGHGHLALLRQMDHVVSMTQSMAQQVQRHIGRTSAVIPNFIDEAPLEQYRSASVAAGPLRFVFTGSMQRGKQPHVLIDALRTLQERGIDAHIDAFGDGPLLEDVRRHASTLRIPGRVRFHGHVEQPYEAIASAHALVLPSLTEGTSRSALEALFLGVPCVLRNIDGTHELIEQGCNGALFDSDDQLPDRMVDVARWSASRTGPVESLLPAAFRQKRAADAYLGLLDRT